MNRILQWRRTCLAVISSAAIVASAGVAHAQEDRVAVTPPAGFTGYDLTIASVRAHSNCDGTVGQFRRDSQQTIEQGIADDMRSSTSARVTAWNWDYSSRHIQLQATGSSPYFRVVYFHGSQNITNEVVAGTYRTPLLKRGSSFSIGMRVSMRHYVSNGNGKAFDVRALGVRFTNSVVHGDHVRATVFSEPYDVIYGCQ